MLSKEELEKILQDAQLAPPEKIKILIVEDSPTVQLLYRHGLPDEVFQKIFSDNGKDALLIYNAWRPDLIILDAMLPVMSGYTVLKAIRLNIGDKSTPIIMSTSLSAKDDVESFLKVGIQGYIVKPFKVQDIFGMILKYYEKLDPIRSKTANEYLMKKSDDRKIADLIDKWD